MKKYQHHLKRILLLLILAIFWQQPGLCREYQTERVVLVIIDGLRYSEGLGDPNHSFTPNMTALASQGALVSNFRNDGVTYTSRAIPAIWCGAWTDIYTFNDPDCGGTSNNYSQLPTVFEYYRKHLSRPAEDCVYTLKALCPWKASFHPEFGEDYWPLYHSEGYSDEDVWAETQEIITELAPHFLLMYLADVDHGGHSGDWLEYTQAISIADSLVGELWETLQNDPEYAGQTTLLISNDHGRHDYNFSGHGDDCDGCRQIQFLAVGPDVHPGFVSETPRVIPDIAPTIGALLGFSTEYASGSPMLELFDESTSTDSKAILPDFGLTSFPNPANASIRISFTLASSGIITLNIYDLQGRYLTNIIQGFYAEGPHQLTWTARNALASELPSGTYLIHLASDSGDQVSKVVLLK